MRKLVLYMVGLSCLYGVWKFGALTFTLLAAGQFFTPMLAAVLAFPLAILAFLFLGKAID